MGGLQTRDQDENEEAVKRAVAMYHRDRAQAEETDAARSALAEMQVPEVYLDAAREQIATEKRKKAEALQKLLNPPVEQPSIRRSICNLIDEASSWVWIVGLIVLSGGYGIFSHFGSSQPSSVPAATTVAAAEPTEWDFKQPRTDWVLNVNQESDVDLTKMVENGVTFERLHVRSFGRDPEVGANSHDASFLAGIGLQTPRNFHGMNKLQFTARGNGLENAYVRFDDADGTYYLSKNLVVGKGWKTYTVDLNQMDCWEDDKLVSGKRIGDTGKMTIQLGDGASDLGDKGTFDVLDVKAF